MIDAGRGVQARPDLVAPFDVRRKRAQRHVDDRRADGRHPPLAEHGLGANEVVVARVLDVGAPGRLRELAVVAVADRAARRGRGHERAAGGRHADDQPRSASRGCTLTRPAICCPELSSLKEGIRKRAGRDGHGGVDDVRRRVHLHAGVPAEPAGERQAVVGHRVADRVARQPAAPAHREQFVRIQGQRIGAQRRQVLIGERIPDEQVVRRVRSGA